MKRTIKRYHLKKEVKDFIIDTCIDILGVVYLLLIVYIFLYLL